MSACQRSPDSSEHTFPAVSQAASQHKGQAADASLSECQQAFPKWAGMEALNDVQPLTPAFKLAGGHRLAAYEKVVQTAGTGKPRGIGDSQQIFRSCQHLLGALLSQVL